MSHVLAVPSNGPEDQGSFEMYWHNEEVIGIENALWAVKRLLPQLETYSGIRIDLGLARLTIFQKPWPTPVYMVTGAISSAELRDVVVMGEKLGLITEGNTVRADGARTIIFRSPDAVDDVSEPVRKLLHALKCQPNVILVQGIETIVSFSPPDLPL
jgi:hypothetical protein